MYIYIYLNSNLNYTIQHYITLHSILFYSIFYSLLFCSILFNYVTLYDILLYIFLSYSVLLNFITYHIISYYILFLYIIFQCICCTKNVPSFMANMKRHVYNDHLDQLRGSCSISRVWWRKLRVRCSCHILRESCMDSRGFRNALAPEIWP